MPFKLNPFTNRLDYFETSGGGGGITDVTATDAGSSVTFDTSGTVKDLVVTDASFNTFLGANSGNALLTGNNNSSFGYNTLPNLTTGSNNIALGINSGNAYSTESGNIAIGNTGTPGDSGVTRIGETQTSAFIAGVAGVTVSNLQSVTIDATTGQLGSANINGFITVTGTLTSAEIKSLRATPIVVIPAQGPGTIIRIISTTSKLNYGGNNAFVAGSANIGLYVQGSFTTTLALLAGPSAIQATQDQYTTSNPVTATVFATVFDNLGAQITNSVVTEISGNAANNNTLSYSITYEVISI